MELDGTWRAALADEGLRREWQDDAFDASAWEAVEVPGHWRSVPAFADTDGPLLYRRSFEAGSPEAGRRSWLTLDGLFYQGDVWLDGAYLGDTEGYFVPHTFDVTEALRARAEHHLAVEVTCSRQHDLTAKRNLTGVFQHWDCLDPDWNPGGIWRPVRVTETGPVRIAGLRVLCREATAERAVVVVRATLDSAGPRTVVLSTTIGPVDHRLEQPLADGTNEVEWSLTINDPVLWWPRALGEPTLQDVTVSVDLPEAGGATSDERRLRTGLREVRMRSWIASVNGERLFLKGSNQGPTRMALAEASADDLARDVDLALDAGLDLLRVHAHVSRPELYEAADERGLLLWQDLPLQWGYARGVRKQAVRQAAAAVELLGHHPSVAIWCGHNEPMAIENDPEMWGDTGAMVRMGLKALAAQQLPTWNKTVLDRSIKRSLEKADGTRPVIAHSGVLPHPPQLDGTDSHLYFGWYHGHAEDLPGFLQRMPRMGRFVTEFGAQAVPTTADFCEPERWPDLDWERLGRTHALQRAVFARVGMPPDAHDTFEQWADRTQEYQASLIRWQVEALRRLKYRPTGGFAQFCFADGHPAITWSVLGHDRVPKLGYDALRAACRPVIVTTDQLPSERRGAWDLALDIHVVSDLREPVADAEVDAVLTWPGGERTWRWVGDLPADSCVRIGTVSQAVPGSSGDLRLDLRCRAGDHEADHHQVTRLLP